MNTLKIRVMQMSAEVEGESRLNERFEPRFFRSLPSINRWTDFKVVYTERHMRAGLCQLLVPFIFRASM